LFDATDPFSVTATPAGKQRYGFELSGPIIRQKSDFTLALEKRDIDELNVVDATTLDANNAPVPFLAAAPASQRLWIASGRGDRQVTSRNSTTISYSANMNNLDNQGVVRSNHCDRPELRSAGTAACAEAGVLSNESLGLRKQTICRSEPVNAIRGAANRVLFFDYRDYQKTKPGGSLMLDKALWHTGRLDAEVAEQEL